MKTPFQVDCTLEHRKVLVQHDSGGDAEDDEVALFWGQECPLCGIKMNQVDRLFATSHSHPDPESGGFSGSVPASACGWL